MPTEAEIIRSAMSILGKRKSKAKAAAARRNGKLGGFSKEQREVWLSNAKFRYIKGSSKQRRKARRAAGRAEQKGQE